MLSAKGVGLLLVSTIMLSVRPRRPLVSGLLAMSVTAVPLVMLGVGSNVWYIVVASLTAGMASSFFGIVWDTTRQTRIPRAVISRVSSYDDLGAYAAIPVGQLLVVPISAAVGMSTVAVYGGVVYFVVSLLPLCLTSVRAIVETNRSDPNP